MVRGAWSVAHAPCPVPTHLAPPCPTLPHLALCAIITHMNIPTAHTLEHIRHMLAYSDVGLGALIWRHGRFRGELAGSPNGRTQELRVRLDGVSYSAAKIVWFLESGQWPIYRLRHINGERDDIRFSNLEETSRVDGPGR